MKYYLLLIIGFSFAACSEDRQNVNTVDSGEHVSVTPPRDTTTKVDAPVTTGEVIKECYRYDKGEEHKSIEINRMQDSAWGNFQWHIEGKDGMKGDFTGNFHGDTLWIIHNAMMEGNLVPREVAFLIKGEKLYEAQGTQEENAKGIYYYKHRKMLEYSDPEPMAKGPCM